jgi:hypothetical protein
MVQVTVADEDRRQVPEHARRHGRHLAPDGYRQVPQQRIRQHSHAIEVDEDGRMAEERQPIAHLVSSDVAR